MSTSFRALVLAGGLALLMPAPARSQEQKPRPSQAASVSQDIHTTRVSIEYFRPVARGRALFGNIVAWGEAWTPGANRATYIEVSDDVRIQGRSLPAGRYSIWMIPRESAPWTVILSRKWDMFHQPYPEGDDFMRFGVEPESGAHMETLAYYFPEVEGYGATLRMHWGTTVIPLQLEAVTR